MGRTMWVNAYELGLFTKPSICYTLKNILHEHGLLIHEVISNYVLINAPGNHVHIMCLIEWNQTILESILQRDDASYVLLYGSPNGYEFSLQNEVQGSFKKAVDAGIAISEAISYKVFSNTPLHKRQAFFGLLNTN